MKLKIWLLTINLFNKKKYHSVKDYPLWTCSGKTANWDKNKLPWELNEIADAEQILVSQIAKAFCFAVRCRRFWRQLCVYICGRAGLLVRMRSQGVAVIMMRSTFHSNAGERLRFCLLPTNQDIHLVLLGILWYIFSAIWEISVCTICLPLQVAVGSPSIFLGNCASVCEEWEVLLLE